MSHFRVRWKRRGYHIHARVFSSEWETDGYAMNGELVFHEVEWRAFLRCFDNSDRDTVSIIPDGNDL